MTADPFLKTTASSLCSPSPVPRVPRDGIPPLVPLWFCPLSHQAPASVPQRPCPLFHTRVSHPLSHWGPVPVGPRAPSHFDSRPMSHGTTLQLLFCWVPVSCPTGTRPFYHRGHAPCPPDQWTLGQLAPLGAQYPSSEKRVVIPQYEIYG